MRLRENCANIPAIIWATSGLRAKVSGAPIVSIPMLLAAYALLLRSVFWFALALIAVAMGYLMATGATDDIARIWLVP
jgi:hypothetical protein